MGCLSTNIRLLSTPCVINVGLVNKPYLINTSLLNEPYMVDARLKNEDYNIHFSLLNPDVIASIEKVSDGLKVSLGVVCTPNKEAYINLSPNVLWFFSENDVLDVNVTSNIKWIVK